MCQTLLRDENSVEDADSIDLLGLAAQHRHCKIKMPWEKGNSVLIFATISQDSAHDKRAGQKKGSKDG